MRTGGISEDRARAIWRRAAELQAAAEARMEERARTLAAGTPDTGHALGLAEVEAAAVEAGISADFVRIALAEGGAGSGSGVALRGWEERGARIMLGSIDPIEYVRVVTGSVDEVAAATMRVLQAHPYTLQPRDVVDLPSGGGRLLIFGVPRYDWSSMANPPFVTNAYMIGLKRVHVTIRPLGGEPTSCELLAVADLRSKARGMWRAGAWTAGGVGIAGGGMGTMVAAAMSLGSALFVLPGLAGFALGAGVTTSLWSATVRYYRRAVEEQLDEAMAMVGSTLRAGALYLGSPG